MVDFLFHSHDIKPVSGGLKRAFLLAASVATYVMLLAPAEAKQGGRTPIMLGYDGSGAFLAGMNAQSSRDMRAAGRFFGEALLVDPRNATLIERAFVAALGDGNFPEAFRLAEQSIQRNSANPLAQAALGIRAIKLKQFHKSRDYLIKAGGGRGRNNDLTVTLLTAWTHVGSGELKRGLDLVDRFQQPELASYRNFFGGLMAEVGGDRAEATRRLTAAYQAEPGTLRVADAYARLIAHDKGREQALKVYEEWESRNAGQPFVQRQIADLKAGKNLPPLVPDVAAGAAEVLYGIGAASGGRESDTALMFLQLADYLSPKNELFTISVAEIFEQMKQWERAGEIYGGIPNTSPYRLRALLGRVVAYERLEKTDESIKTLTTLLAESPREYEAVDMLGGIYRTKKRFPESIEVYTKAINGIEKPERAHWTLFFGRAVGYERNKEWPKAEADFLKALDLLPETPRTAREKYERAQVLNYLAYSWVDQGMHIERSFDMLKKAVELVPDDGAIVDSLGWAYYRLGKYNDAVRELEKAVELKAGDPTINDHLGDAYWHIGRKLEAGFKWNHARDSKPDPEDLEKILKKIKDGLDEKAEPAPVTVKSDK